ncbi:MAG TPA: glycosyltransferase [Bryobacteraceae bacterium]|nr:glycosyltransferase [Bryobacteraceae bacterium]
MIAAIAAIAAAAIAYQVASLLAAWRHLRAPASAGDYTPAISVLKPVRGLDPDFYEAIRSHAAQDYPAFEILFGTADESDPALSSIRRLAADHLGVPMRVIVSSTSAPNQKAGILCDLAAAARHSVYVVSDSDVKVPQDWLRGIVAPLADSRTGVVTCLYRPVARTAAGVWEALGVATDFAPSILVARWIGVREFGLGSTLVFRAADLERAGGFPAIAGYLADDYQLSKRISGLGLETVLSRTVVETSLGEDGWTGVWKHQVRWARTIRVSRGGGYAGLPVTHAGVWVLASAIAGLWPLAFVLLLLRIASGALTGIGVLGSGIVKRWFLAAPLWDLWAFAIWIAGLLGTTVEWRGRKLELSREGRIKNVD